MGKRAAEAAASEASPGKCAKQPAAQQQPQVAEQPAGAPPAQQRPAAQQQPAAPARFESLMISKTKPFRPVKPSTEEIVAGTAVSVRMYMRKLQAYAWWSYSVFLHDDEVIKLRTPLYASASPKIDNTPKNAPATSADWRPTSIKEPLDMEQLLSALTHSNFYEGAISIWNIDIMKPALSRQIFS